MLVAEAFECSYIFSVLMVVINFYMHFWVSFCIRF